MGYIFDPATIHEIGKKAVGKAHEEQERILGEELERAFPGHINRDQPWIYSLAAGATGVMKIFHASLTEYVLFFGTPIGTEAFSGRYLLDIYDVVTAGDMWTYTDRNFRTKTITRPGEMAHLRRDEVKGFRLPDGCWMLEYGRGPVPTALPVALGDSIFSAMDPVTLYDTLRIYGKLVVKELRQGKI